MPNTTYDHTTIQPSIGPRRVHDLMRQRSYGMFIHYGINTFLDVEWSEGSDPATAYAPEVIDTDQWALTAKEAGMSHVILTAKHHEGFCLWPSQATTFTVETSHNPTDVLASMAESCRRHGIAFGLYYSLWDRHWGNGVMRANGGNELTPGQSAAYVDYMLRQLDEMFTRYGPICELWLDGSWVQTPDAWDVPAIYHRVKQHQPDCAMAVNWTIGDPNNPIDGRCLPVDQREGYPIRYFPSDFRLADPHLPAADDPKCFTRDGQTYYLPYETTICLNDRWFHHTEDDAVKTVEELAEVFRIATANDNTFVLNSPPNRDGVMPVANVERLRELARHLTLI